MDLGASGQKNEGAGELMSMGATMEPIQRNRPAEVQFVEDNPGDVRFTQQALEDGEKFNLHLVGDGKKALNFLNRLGDFRMHRCRT